MNFRPTCIFVNNFSIRNISFKIFFHLVSLFHLYFNFQRMHPKTNIQSGKRQKPTTNPLYKIFSIKIKENRQPAHRCEQCNGRDYWWDYYTIVFYWKKKNCESYIQTYILQDNLNDQCTNTHSAVDISLSNSTLCF